MICSCQFKSNKESSTCKVLQYRANCNLLILSLFLPDLQNNRNMFRNKPNAYAEGTEEREVYAEYEAIKKENSAIDFFDMISLVVDELRQNEDMINYYQHRSFLKFESLRLILFKIPASVANIEHYSQI